MVQVGEIERVGGGVGLVDRTCCNRMVKLIDTPSQQPSDLHYNTTNEKKTTPA
jgi:hypothetical protein